MNRDDDEECRHWWAWRCPEGCSCMCPDCWTGRNARDAVLTPER